MTVSPTAGVASSPVYGTAGASTTGATTSMTPTSSAEDSKQMFLQLLVAQLRYQDPSNPTDSSQFLSQTAQFTALEKMEDVAAQSKAMVSAQMAFGASSLVGRTVSYPSTDGKGTTLTGRVDGVRFGATGPVLTIGGTDVPVSSVLGVEAESAATSGSSSTTAAATAS